MIDLIRIPSKRYERTQQPDFFSLVSTGALRKYDYKTADGRWYLQYDVGCGPPMSGRACIMQS